MRAAVVVVGLACGCGRVKFDPVGADSAYAREVLVDHPAAYFRFDEAGGTTASSRTGSATGTYLGPMVFGTDGAVNDGDTCVTLDGSATRIELGDVFPFPGTLPYSIEIWIRPAMLDQFSRWIIDRRTSAPSEGYTMYMGATFVLFARVTNGSEFGYVSATSKLGWTYLVATFDSAQDHWYIDGVEVEHNFAAGQAIGSGAATFVVGDLAAGLSHKYWGDLDELAIYDYALTPERITAHWTAAAP